MKDDLPVDKWMFVVGAAVASVGGVIWALVAAFGASKGPNAGFFAIASALAFAVAGLMLLASRDANRRG